MNNKRLMLTLLMCTIVLSACKPDQKASEKQKEEAIFTLASTATFTESESSSSNQENNKPNQLVFENTDYDYEVVTGATRTTFGSNPKPLYDYEEKLKKMFWSSQPPLGLMEGNYYTNTGYFDVGNQGIVEIITDDSGKIINVEFNEYGAEGYYESKYAGANKRLSDYAFFQAKNPRTDTTLVTMVNGISFVEKQMREQNRIDGNFETVQGSSTSAREGLMTIATELKDTIRQPSATQYIGYAEDLGNGLVGRIQLTIKNGKIETAGYDEYFADQPEQIKDEQLKEFYRQSKYFSIDYNQKTGNDFVKFSDRLTQTIVEKQQLSFEDDLLSQHASFESYKKLIAHITVDE